MRFKLIKFLNIFLYDAFFQFNEFNHIIYLSYLNISTLTFFFKKKNHTLILFYSTKENKNITLKIFMIGLN